MIPELKPYPATKESCVPSLAVIPAHWNETRAKYFFREVDERSTTGTEELLSVSHKTGVTPRSQKNVTMFLAESTVGHKLCRPGDVVVNTMWAWMGALGVAEHIGLVSPSYGVYRPHGASFIPEFLDHLLRTPAYIAEYLVRSTGITTSRLRLYPEQFLRVLFVYPPLKEQAAIVRYLDHADRRIRRYIRAKQKLIKLLEEQKQAIIHRAVTRGLDPNVRLKPSGVEWFGDVPQHWEVRRAKAVCSAIIDCKNRTPDAIENGSYTVVRTTCIRDGHFNEAGAYKTDEKNHRAWTARGAPRNGDVFFTREAPAGEACIVPDRTDVCMGQRMMYFRPNPELLDPRFLLLNIYGPFTRRYVELATNGSTVGHLRLGQVYALPLLWCPLEEQREIVTHVDDKTHRIERARSDTHREIELLREYRTCLIADVVTGKLDVRDAAARLPDELQEPEALDDAEAETDVEEAAEGGAETPEEIEA